MEQYPVKLGTMLFTMVDPHRGHEKAYNRWYERDHFYAGCMIGPWLFAGGRFVATRELKDLRFPDDQTFVNKIDDGSYFAIYWKLEGHEQEHDEWALSQVQWLYANGRGFPERTHAHTGGYDLIDTIYADDDGVPVELALDHCFAGLSVVSVEAALGVSRDELQSWLESNAVPDLLKTGGIDCYSMWKFTPYDRSEGNGAPMSLGSDGGNPDRIVGLCFLSVDPRTVWDSFRSYAKAVEAGGKGKVAWAAPFFSTVVGTDKYTDQLW
jgi:hypothetical protein